MTRIIVDHNPDYKIGALDAIGLRQQVH